MSYGGGGYSRGGGGGGGGGDSYRYVLLNFSQFYFVIVQPFPLRRTCIGDVLYLPFVGRVKQ